MSFFDKLKYGFQRAMQGRYGGADRLNRTLIYGCLALVILNMFLHSTVLSILSTATLVWAFFRMFSRNATARYQENIRFEQIWSQIVLRVKQFITRMKNIRTTKYFHCPKCKSLLKMPRGVGEKTVTCGKCGEKFRQKA